MKKLIPVLKKCMLFTQLNEMMIESLLNFLNYSIVDYKKGTTIAFEDDLCDALAIVISGTIELQNLYPSGKVVTITEMSESDIFGEALLFSKFNHYPITITTSTKASVMYIKKEDMVHGLTHHPILLQNFLGLLSNKLFMLNTKVKVLSLDTIRQKIVSFLLEQYKIQGNMKLKIGLSRKRMAEHMAVQRPSLSRELIKMKEEGLIEYDKHFIEIVDIEALEMEII